MTTTETVLPGGRDLQTAIAEGRRTYELDRRHVFHSWSAQAQIKPMTIVAADGSFSVNITVDSLWTFSTMDGGRKGVPAAVPPRSGGCCLASPR
jgi:taurine--2-oxoglutarate transaminase